MLRIFAWFRKPTAPATATPGQLHMKALDSDATALIDLGTCDGYLKLYVAELEAGPSDVWCYCAWAVHPDDKGKPRKNQRRRLLEQHPHCPTHTKEGLVYGFMTWYTRRVVQS